ncbi:serine hydrolase domain-containing protein [Streptomyces capitiformicae]|uniref:Serine hydrolase n=1 Tax=Streptomyces capitiformicae TaxID=2014920 RepID=A0A918ZD41_9ACTN|nr:serine hydrolase domain-containing protein [Streptomyces capitiformicae]GHE46869.1 serine hydrolase [Streptomyces capitiformicae]
MGQTGFAQDRLDHFCEVVERDVRSGLYYGGAFRIARGGETALDVAIGHGDADGTVPVRTDSVFSVFSVTKAFINVLVLRAVERGQFGLTTKMVDLVPEFAGPPRDRATILHFLTHTTGMPGVWEPKAGQPWDRLDETFAAVCELIHGTSEPGTRCDYAPMANHALLATALVRTDPQQRSITEILHQDLFEPLDMRDTTLGIRPESRARHLVPDTRGTVPIKVLSHENDDEFGLFTAERNECTWAGASSTSGDLFRLAEMLRGEGALGEARILSPRTVRMARRVWTGDLPNELYKAVALRAGYPPPPANMGLGFNVRGSELVNHQLGTLTSPETFGNYGAGSMVFWIDPELDITFVGLTAGLLPQARNIERFERLADIVVGAAL